MSVARGGAPRPRPKTSVGGRDYVLHVDRPGYDRHVWCGRLRERVNRDADFGDVTEPREEHCQNCLRCRSLATTVSCAEVAVPTVSDTTAVASEKRP